MPLRPFAYRLSLLLVLAAACQRPQDEAPAAPASIPLPPPVEEVPAALAGLAWTSYSGSAGARLTQHPRGPGLCELSCTVGNEREPRWRMEGCRAQRTDFRFVAADCSHALLLYERPAKVNHWPAAVLALALTSSGEEVPLHAAHMLSGAGALRRSGGSFFWLAGTGGLLGRRPRYLPDGGGAELETADGTALRIHFADARFGAWRQPVADLSPAAVAASASGMVRWTDDEGTVHYDESLAAVPARYRRRAVRTLGDEISQVAGDPRLKQAAVTQPAAYRPSALRPRTATTPVPSPARPSTDPGSVYKAGEDHIRYTSELGYKMYKIATTPGGLNALPELHTETHLKEIPACKPERGACASRLDCCSGSCVSGACQ